MATRPVNLIGESERSARLSGVKGRGLAGRVVVLDASRGDLDDLIEFDRPPSELTGVDAASDKPSNGSSIIFPRGGRNMNFHALHRVSVYVMMVLATLVLNIDATGDNKLAMFYPPAAAIAAVFAFFLVDRREGVGISRGLANGLVRVAPFDRLGDLFERKQPCPRLGALACLFRTNSDVSIQDGARRLVFDPARRGSGRRRRVSEPERSGRDRLGLLGGRHTLGARPVLPGREARRNEKKTAGKVFPAPKPEDPYPGLITPAYICDGAGGESDVDARRFDLPRRASIARRRTRRGVIKPTAGT